MGDGPAINNEGGIKTPVRRQASLDQAGMLMKEKFIKEAQTNPGIGSKVREAALSGKDSQRKITPDQPSTVSTKAPLVMGANATQDQAPPTITSAETNILPPTAEELKAGIRPETQKLIDDFKKDTSGRI